MSMTDQELQKLKYPIGKFEVLPSEITKSQIDEWIGVIAQFPDQVQSLTKELTVDQLKWRYRPNGWCISQVVHHCADSHMNSIIRFKLALTEDLPDIKPYYEDRWADLPDSLEPDISDALAILTGLHHKWVLLLQSLDNHQLHRQYRHPEHGKVFDLAETIGNYAWHCQHHEAHIVQAIKYQGEFS